MASSDEKREKEIVSRGGFIGIYLDEDTVALLESKLGKESIKMEVFYFIAVDREGHSTLMVPVERAKAASFVTEAKAFADASADAFRETGECWQLEEIERMWISRFKRQGACRQVVNTAQLKEVGDDCRGAFSYIKSIK